MDCLEFRRLLGSDPRVSDRAAREHLEGCPFCADAHARAQAFENRLADALAVPVPDGLAERILLAQLTAARRQARDRRRRAGWIALAAAACLVLAIGVVRHARPPVGLADLVVQHVTGKEHGALRLTAVVPAAEIEQAFADRGVRLASVPRDVSYVHECPVGAYRSVHMVMPENGAPVSVLYIVDHRAKGAATFQRDHLQAREVPVANGTLVLVAPSTERFDAIERTWREAIEGPPRAVVASF